ncbi:MAG: mechanosensitive ion channel [Chloroflexi bacterium]|nr:mechanosensitive ion channel [Chloroflexota bacterium]
MWTYRLRKHAALIVAIAATIIGGAMIALTTQLAADTPFGYLARHRNSLIAGEVAFFGVIVVELIGRIIIRAYRDHGASSIGIMVRAVLRVVCYVVIGVSIVSLFAANPALAISVGGVTGVVIAFSAQNLIGNAFAGMFLAIGRPFTIGDEITALGNTGKVVEIGLMYITLETPERWIK